MPTRPPDEGLRPSSSRPRQLRPGARGSLNWGQIGERIARLREAVDLAIYTPGRTAGLPLTVFRSFDAPPARLIEQAEAYRERITSAVSGLLALLGIAADPITSREHILLATVFDHSWREGQNLSIANLIQAVQSPPFQKVGVLDLESFSRQRSFALAMSSIIYLRPLVSLRG